MRVLFSDTSGYVERYLFRTFVWQTGLAIVGVLLSTPGGVSVMAGWLGGTTFNIAYLTLIWLNACVRRYDIPIARGSRVAAMASARFFLAVLFLTVVAKVGTWHIGAAVCGLLSLQIVFYLDTFWSEFKNRLR